MSGGDRHEAERAELASDSRRDPLIGSLVNGKYRVTSAIARGGMGRIYYATQVPLERPVALKVVQGDGDNEHESQFLKRFLQEASILAKLQHPNVVTLYDYGKIEGAHVEQYFIAMEFLAGETLTHRLKVRQRLPVGEVLILARQIVRGLREAHKRGIVHRDLKPSNIIIVPEGDGSEIVKLVDFGIGKMMGRPEDAQDLTQDGVFVGTPRYMAPEQFDGTAYPASDIYALGTIMFQALAGRLPFEGANMAELMVAKLARPVPLLREAAPGVEVPDSVEMLVHRLLFRDPHERPTMDQLAQLLMSCEDEVFGSAHNLRQGLGSSGGSWPRGSFAPTSSSPLLPHPVDSRVPPTVIAAVPALPPIAQLTPRPMATSAAPPPAEKKASRAPLAVMAVLLVAGALAFGIYWVKVRAASPAAVASSTPSATSAPSESAAPAPTAFKLTIESAPSGATVMEGERTLGTTPFEISIERASVASGPRTFAISKDGFVASHVDQGASDDNVHSMVSLAPDTSSAVKSRPQTKPTATGTPPRPPGTSTSDIRLKR
ncbi:MAG: protein kinase [Labilithrix sp.]|nr:protein kinase [Labilithrix sp.]